MAVGGVAGFVMANGSLSSNTSGEGEIRRKIVEADLVDCIVALPAQLFFTTGIPVCLWFLTRDRTGRNIRRGTPNRPGGRAGETLFIDARKLGTMQTRVLRVLSGIEEAECVPGTGDPLPTSDLGRIVYAYRRWRGEPAPDWWNEKEHDAEPFAEKYPRLVAELEEHFAEGERLVEVIRANLRRLVDVE
jgi:type I restriction enzyme M protein